MRRYQFLFRFLLTGSQGLSLPNVTDRRKARRAVRRIRRAAAQVAPDIRVRFVVAPR